MSDTEVKWGGMLGDIRDASSGATVSPRFFGEGALQVTDAAAFARSVASAGDEATLVDWVKGLVVNALRNDIGARSQDAPFLAVAADERAMAESIEAVLDETLQPMGARLRVATVHLMVDDETRAMLVQSSAQRASPAAAAPGAIPPGSHVFATWTDGQTYGASVRGFDGTNYEIAWDGGSAVAWVPASAVRRT